MRPFRHLLPATERGRALASLACAVVVLAAGVTAAATHADDESLRVATEVDDRTIVLPPITIPELPPSTVVDLPGLVTTTTVDVPVTVPPVTVPPVTVPQVTLPSLPQPPRETGAVDEVEELGLYVVRPDGTGLRRLADHCLARRPAWSPDGTRLACHTAGREITVVRVADGATTVLASSSAATTFSWSPDGTHVAFIQGTSKPRDVAIAPRTAARPWSCSARPTTSTSRRGGPTAVWPSMGYAGLWTFAADGSGLTHVYEEPLDFGRLAWSPDGSQLLSANDSTNDVVMNADGSNVRPLGSRYDGEFPGAWDADWAPDGRRVVWYENAARTGSEILHVGLPEGPWVEVARDVVEPDWSPVADVIAGARLTSDGMRRELVTVGAGGDVRVVVHAARAQVHEPSWSPDGSLIAFGTTQDYDIPPQ